MEDEKLRQWNCRPKLPSQPGDLLEGVPKHRCPLSGTYRGSSPSPSTSTLQQSDLPLKALLAKVGSDFPASSSCCRQLGALLGGRRLRESRVFAHQSPGRERGDGCPFKMGEGEGTPVFQIGEWELSDCLPNGRESQPSVCPSRMEK